MTLIELAETFIHDRRITDPKDILDNLAQLLADFHREQSEWVAIATAPKDGTWILLTDGVKVSPAYWGPTYFSYDPAWITYSHRTDYETVELDNPPTHWMPLPAPPTETGA